jgi:hypothetical protein
MKSLKASINADLTFLSQVYENAVVYLFAPTLKLESASHD